MNLARYLPGLLNHAAPEDDELQEALELAVVLGHVRLTGTITADTAALLRDRSAHVARLRREQAAHLDVLTPLFAQLPLAA